LAKKIIRERAFLCQFDLPAKWHETLLRGASFGIIKPSDRQEFRSVAAETSRTGMARWSTNKAGHPRGGTDSCQTSQSKCFLCNDASRVPRLARRSKDCLPRGLSRCPVAAHMPAPCDLPDKEARL